MPLRRWLFFGPVRPVGTLRDGRNLKRTEMKHAHPIIDRNPAGLRHPQLPITEPHAGTHSKPICHHVRWIALAAVLIGCLTTAALGATLPIIPLPAQMQPRPGVFTLCPSQPVPGVPARASTRIFVDSASLQNGQYLAMMLFRSTGYQFVVATNSAAGPIRGAVLLTTVNANSGLGAEGYELTVAPDSVVVRAPAQAGVFYGVQSLLQLLPPQILSPQPVAGVTWTAPCVYIQDQPRFGWRGRHARRVAALRGQAGD